MILHLWWFYTHFENDVLMVLLHSCWGLPLHDYSSLSHFFDIRGRMFPRGRYWNDPKKCPKMYLESALNIILYISKSPFCYFENPTSYSCLGGQMEWEIGLTRILEQPYQNSKFPSEAFLEGLLWRVISFSTQSIGRPIIYPWKALWVSYPTHFVSPHLEFGGRSYVHFRKTCPCRIAISSERNHCSSRPIFFLSVGTFL